MESISVGLDGFSIIWYYCMVLLHGPLMVAYVTGFVLSGAHSLVQLQ